MPRTEQEVLDDLATIDALIKTEDRDRTQAESDQTLALKQELKAIRNPPPPPPPPLTPTQERQRAYDQQLPLNEVIEALFEHIAEGRPEKLDALQAKRVQIKLDYPLE